MGSGRRPSPRHRPFLGEVPHPALCSAPQHRDGCEHCSMFPVGTPCAFCSEERALRHSLHSLPSLGAAPALLASAQPPTAQPIGHRCQGAEKNTGPRVRASHKNRVCCHGDAVWVGVVCPLQSGWAWSVSMGMWGGHGPCHGGTVWGWSLSPGHLGPTLTDKDFWVRFLANAHTLRCPWSFTKTLALFHVCLGSPKWCSGLPLSPGDAWPLPSLEEPRDPCCAGPQRKDL